MKAKGALSSNELQWYDLTIEHQDSSGCNDRQDDMPYSTHVAALRAVNDRSRVILALTYWGLGPLLLTWFNLNPSMDKLSHGRWSVGWNYLSTPKLQSCTVEVWEWIRNFIPHFVMVVITYPCWDSNGHVSKKGSQVTMHQWAGPSL